MNGIDLDSMTLGQEPVRLQALRWADARVLGAKAGVRLVYLLICLASSMGDGAELGGAESAGLRGPAPKPSNGKAPQSVDALLRLKAEELERVDLAVMNLLCAEGLRGTENLDISSALETLESWSRHVASETSRNFHRFATNAKAYGNSLAYYRMLMLATVLQEDFGTMYNPDRARPQLRGEWESNDSFFADSRDVFLHGLLGGRHAGTCSSLPVLYVAVAQRLGYPVYLASAKGHFYVRYEDGDNHLNVEATSVGFNAYPDEHYRHWPRPTSDEEASQYGLLRPLTQREVLGAFLTIRANSLTSMKRFDAAAEAWSHAARLLPDTPALKQLVAHAQARASHEAEADRWDRLWDEVAGLSPPFGPSAARFREWQFRVQWFMNQTTNLVEIQEAVTALEAEWSEERQQARIHSDSPPLLLTAEMNEKARAGSQLASPLAAALQPIAIRIAAERVPPEYWRSIPAELQEQLRGLKDEEDIVTEMWKFYASRLNEENRGAMPAGLGTGDQPAQKPFGARRGVTNSREMTLDFRAGFGVRGSEPSNPMPLRGPDPLAQNQALKRLKALALPELDTPASILTQNTPPPRIEIIPPKGTP